MTHRTQRHEVEALRDNLLGDLLGERDPIVRYHALTREQELFDALVSEIKRQRGLALVEARESMTLVELVEAAGLGSYQRVQQLIAAGR